MRIWDSEKKRALEILIGRERPRYKNKRPTTTIKEKKQGGRGKKTNYVRWGLSHEDQNSLKNPALIQ